MKCPNCNSENAPRAKFCGNCGQPLNQNEIMDQKVSANQGNQMNFENQWMNTGSSMNQGSQWTNQGNSMNQGSQWTNQGNSMNQGSQWTNQGNSANQWTNQENSFNQGTPINQGFQMNQGTPMNQNIQMNPDKPPKKKGKLLKTIGIIAGIVVGIIVILFILLCFFSSDDTDTSAVEETPETDVAAEGSGDDFVVATDASLVDGLHGINKTLLYIDTANALYWYQTPQGRVGMGDYESSDSGLAIIYNDFYYDLMYRASDQVVSPYQNGESDEEDPYNLDYVTFFPDEEDSINFWDIEELDGTWTNNKGETITIDSSAMEFEAYSDPTSTGGTIGDDGNGKGVYLYLNGYAYICMGQDHNRFMLQFESSEYGEPDGTFTGVFYRDGDIASYTDLANESCYTDEDGHTCYTDGVESFILPWDYDLVDDWATDGDGNLFGR